MLACALLLALALPAADAHARTRHRASGCAHNASYHARHPGRRTRSRRCVRRHPKRSTSLHRSRRRHIVSRHGGRSSDAGCPGAGQMPTEANLELIRSAVVCLENREREARSEAPLAVDAALQNAAQTHSESMAGHGYFGHVGPDGTPMQRMRAAGYLSDPSASYEVGENLAWGTLWLGTPRAIVACWMASAGHRANILDARFRDTAVGVAVHLPRSLTGGQSGGMYTQDFGVIIAG